LQHTTMCDVSIHVDTADPVQPRLEGNECTQAESTKTDGKPQTDQQTEAKPAKPSLREHADALLAELAMEHNLQLDWHYIWGFPQNHVEKVYNAQLSYTRHVGSLFATTILAAIDLTTGIRGIATSGLEGNETWTMPPYVFVGIGCSLLILAMVGCCESRVSSSQRHTLIYVIVCSLAAIFGARAVVFSTIKLHFMPPNDELNAGVTNQLLSTVSILVAAHAYAPLWAFVAPIAVAGICVTSPRATVSTLVYVIAGVVLALGLAFIHNKQRRELFSAKLQAQCLSTTQLRMAEVESQALLAANEAIQEKLRAAGLEAELAQSALSVRDLEATALQSENKAMQDKLKCAQLESDLSSLKLLLERQIQGGEMLPEQVTSSRVSRPAEVCHAWTEKWQTLNGETSEVNIRIPCAACYTEDGHTFKANMLRPKGMGKPVHLKPGSHPFVKIAGEDFLRVGLMSAEFGSASGHPQLAAEQPVLFAGEVEFDDNHRLQRWNNLSGTYKCADNKAYQAGLPMDKLFVVELEHDTTGPQTSTSGSLQLNSNGQFICVSNDIVLRKVLTSSDLECEELKLQWAEILKEIYTEYPQYQECYQALMLMTQERQAAIDKYGYLSVTSISTLAPAEGVWSG